jgi:hypothetical protein
MLLACAMLGGPPTGLQAVGMRGLAREDVWLSRSRLECQAHLSEGDILEGAKPMSLCRGCLPTASLTLISVPVHPEARTL